MWCFEGIARQLPETQANEKPEITTARAFELSTRYTELMDHEGSDLENLVHPTSSRILAPGCSSTREFVYFQ